MQLLVSVTIAVEASAALAGGADLLDAKDPAGRVTVGRVRVLRHACDGIAAGLDIAAI